MSPPRILAIESSCDETGVAVVVGGRRIEANEVATQVALHAATGGIVPEVAARQQLRWIVPTLEAEGSAECRFGPPIVDGDRAAVEWSAETMLKDGGTEKLAGVSLLRFDTDGLVVEQRDFWAAS